MTDKALRDQYQECVRCVMDTSDSWTTFDENGVCSHCREFETTTKYRWFPNQDGAKKWNAIVERMKAEGKGNDYDCIIGLSGGVDSSYLVLKAKEKGLRALIVHVDAGWNSELAVSNIENVVKFCGYDLYTHVVDWEDMRQLHLSYLKSGISNQDVPQDHVFFAALYKLAAKHRIKSVLSGGNIATEGIAPKSWHGAAMDSISLKAIHKRFGEKPLKSYETIGFFNLYIWLPFFQKLTVYRPLNFMDYNKKLAIKELDDTTGWRAYKNKHGESLFTKLFQNYYLVERFGYDKRRPHLSSLIVSGQMTRDEAVQELSSPLYAPDELEIDIEFLCKKLRISRSEFELFMTCPKSVYEQFPNWNFRLKILKSIQQFTERLLGRTVGRYS